MDEIIIEKLMERRDFYLYTLKHLEFQFLTESISEGNAEYEKVKTSATNQLKKNRTRNCFSLVQKRSLINNEFIKPIY